ncbi:MAG TPA: glycosyltransferase family 4 protein [Flavipsychrobacter sp.]|nr:glycosyltransferase family 4 protein [Flavipsychrobacter sp.]
MRIVLVSQEFPPETAKGGIGTQTYMKAHGLAALGHEVVVLSRSIDNIVSKITQGKVTVIRIPGMEDALPEMTLPVQWLSYSVKVAEALNDIHSESPIDIIDFPEWAAEGYVYLLNRTEWNKVPVVVQLHGPLIMLAETIGWPEKGSTFLNSGVHMEATSVQLADAVYSSSGCSAEWIRKYYDTTRNSIPVIHTGIDTQKFTMLAVEKNARLTVVFVGKAVKNKGVEELLRAVIHLRREIPEIQLRLIGGGERPVLDKLQEIVAESNADDVLEIAGYIHKQDLAEELSKAHVFAAPSYYEGGPGFVYLEAMACGLPVVACSGSGINEIVEHGHNGFLVPPREVEPLAEALSLLLKDAGLREQMGNNAHVYAMANADSEVCIRRLEAFYQSVLEKQRESVI